jgi:hypothetical protein
MHMNSSKRPHRGESPDPLPGQTALTFGPDAADVQAGPEVQANGKPGSNGPTTATVRADVAKPEADPFDLSSLRLSQDFAAAAGVKKLVTTIPIRKPSKEWFVRTHPGSGYRLQTAVLELKEEREIYLVAPALRSDLADEPTISPRMLVTAINRQGVLFLWPIRLPGADGRIDDWNRSAMDAVDEAQTRWVRVQANMGLGAYEVAVGCGTMPEPAWPDLPFQEIIKIAFRDRMISEWSHPVLRRLRGEA